MPDFDKMLALIEAMNRENVEYILFGALALNAHGIIPATTDADFFVRPTPENMMPVFKYRRVEDMPQDHWLPPGDPAIPRKIRMLWSWARFAGPLHIPRGVHKYHSIEEMDAARDRWEQERVDRIRAERAR